MTTFCKDQSFQNFVISCKTFRDIWLYQPEGTPINLGREPEEYRKDYLFNLQRMSILSIKRTGCFF